MYLSVYGVFSDNCNKNVVSESSNVFPCLSYLKPSGITEDQ